MNFLKCSPNHATRLLPRRLWSGTDNYGKVLPAAPVFERSIVQMNFVSKQFCSDVRRAGGLAHMTIGNHFVFWFDSGGVESCPQRIERQVFVSAVIKRDIKDIMRPRNVTRTRVPAADAPVEIRCTCIHYGDTLRIKARLHIFEIDDGITSRMRCEG